MAGPYDTGQLILTDVLSRADELGIGASTREADAKRYIQASYIAVVDDGFPWWWAKKDPPGVLQTFDAITAGAVAVTNGSATITFSVAPATSVAGWKFVVDGDGIVYRVLSHAPASTTATLDAPYIGLTSTATAYHVFQDEFTLAADFLRPLQTVFLRDMHGNCHVELRNEDEQSYRYTWPGTFDLPKSCAFIAPRKIALKPSPVIGRRYEVHYLYHPTQALTGGILPFDNSGNDALIIQPPEDRIIVAFFALANLLTDKNDNRAATYSSAASSKLDAMKRLGHKHMHARRWVETRGAVGAPR